MALKMMKATLVVFVGHTAVLSHAFSDSKAGVNVLSVQPDPKCVDGSMGTSRQGCDPADSWVAYATAGFGEGKRITLMNLTVEVPRHPANANFTAYECGSIVPPEFRWDKSDPLSRNDSKKAEYESQCYVGASFWFGLQTHEGTGALIQPVLAWGQAPYFDAYEMFLEVFDWRIHQPTTKDKREPLKSTIYGNWSTPTVQPGDILTQSVIYREATNSYDMYISSKNDPRKSLYMNYTLDEAQTATESTAYIVLEVPSGHPPCSSLPSSGGVTFSNIVIEVDGKRVRSPPWQTETGAKPLCKAEALKLDADTVRLQWDPTSG